MAMQIHDGRILGTAGYEYGRCGGGGGCGGGGANGVCNVQVAYDLEVSHKARVCNGTCDQRRVPYRCEC